MNIKIKIKIKVAKYAMGNCIGELMLIGSKVMAQNANVSISGFFAIL